MNRRELLKASSLAGGSLLLAPVAAQLRAHAAGAAKAPARFVFVVEGGGLPPFVVQPPEIPLSAVWRKWAAEDRLKPENYIRGSDKLIDKSLSDCTLPPHLEPLKAFKDRVTIVQGLSHRSAAPGNHSAWYGLLSCTRSGSLGPKAETVDSCLGKALPAIFPTIGLGITADPAHTIIHTLSAAGPDFPLPIQCRPNLAHRAFFGSLLDPRAKAELEIKTNVLDFLKEDVRGLRDQLAGEERRRLDHYLQSFETLKERGSRLNQIASTLRANAPVAGDKYTSDVEADRLDAHFDLAAAALVCGLTNSLTISAGAGYDSYFDICWKGLGIPDRKHSLNHGMNYEKPGKSDEKLGVIRRYHMELIARLAAKLAAVPEGDGTMLDNTVIFYTSDFGEAHHSQAYTWPVVMLGNLKGRMKLGNRFVEYPKYGTKGHATLANLYQSFLAAAGAPRAQFGVRDPGLAGTDPTGPLSELMA